LRRPAGRTGALTGIRRVCNGGGEQRSPELVCRVDRARHHRLTIIIIIVGSNGIDCVMASMALLIIIIIIVGSLFRGWEAAQLSRLSG